MIRIPQLIYFANNTWKGETQFGGVGGMIKRLGITENDWPCEAWI
jgi:hypothetical protein